MNQYRKCLLGYLLAAILCLPCDAQDKKNEFAADIEKASKLVEKKKYKEASNILAGVVKKDKDNAEAWQMLGFTLHAAKDFDRAIIVHKKAATYKEAAISANYNLSCAYAIKGEKNEALDYLEKVLDAGFDDVTLIRRDDELKNIRKEPRFEELLKRVGNQPTTSSRAATSSSDSAKPSKAEGKDLSVANFPIELLGDWAVVRMIAEGQDIVSAELPRVSITRNILKLGHPDGSSTAFAYKADLKRKPNPAIGFRVLQGEAKGNDGAGIASGGGDLITICYHVNGKKLPKKFESTRENGQSLLVLERDEASIHRADLIGKWDFVGGERSGENVDNKRLVVGVTITRDTIMLPGSHGQPLLIRFATDSTQSPIELNMIMIDAASGQATSTGLGILELKDGRLSICYDPAGKTRPKNFSTSKQNGFSLFRLKSGAKP